MNIFYGIIFLFSVVIDQLSKWWAVIALKDGKSIKLIEGFLRFYYVENRGAAFGILQDKIWFLVIVTVLMFIILAYIFFKNKNITKLSKISLVLIGGGALGNFIDRVKIGYVVDFIDVRFGNIYDFPVFNLADSFVVCGTFILIILILMNKFEKGENKNE